MNNLLSKLEVTINSFSYNKKKIFDNATVSFYPNNIYVLKGKNGTGKTTLYNILCGKLHFDGYVKINNEVCSDKQLSNLINYINQDSIVFDDLNLVDNILLPYEYEDKKKALDLLNQFGFVGREYEKANILSNGEKELLCFARVLYNDKPIIILDEFNAYLDKTNTKKLFDVLTNLKKNHLIIFSSHDNLDDSFSKQCCLIELIDHKLHKLGSDIKNDISYEIKKTNIITSLIRIFCLNKGLIITFFLMNILLSSLYLISNNLDYNLNVSNNVNAPIMAKIEETYKTYTPAFYFEEEVDNNVFDSHDVLRVHREPNTSFKIKRSLVSLNEYNNNIVELIDDEYRLPKNENEVIISDTLYHEIKEIMKKQYKEDNVEKHIFSNEVFPDFKIVGVYNDDNDEQVKSIQKIILDNHDCSTDFFYSFYFKTYTLFTYQKQNDFFGNIVLNRNDNKNLVSDKDLQSIYSTFSPNGAFYTPLLIKKDGKDFYNESYANFISIISSVSLIMFIVFCIVYNYYYYNYNKKRYLLMRFLNETRRNQIKNNLISHFIVLVFVYLISSFVSIVTLFVLNKCMKGQLILHVSILINNVGIIYLFLLFLMIFFLIVFLINSMLFISPKNINKRINEVKSK